MPTLHTNLDSVVINPDSYKDVFEELGYVTEAKSAKSGSKPLSYPSG